MVIIEKSKNRLSWEVPEHKRIVRHKYWYIIASFFAFLLIFFSFFTISNFSLVFLGAQSNFLFALIIIIIATLMIINESQDPLVLVFSLNPEGVSIGRRFYDYSAFKHFSVIYKPSLGLKQLYLEFKNPVQPRLSIPLRRMDALTVRNYLVRFLEEDLDRTHPPLSEQLTKMLKL
jgi:hypothetical protein